MALFIVERMQAVDVDIDAAQALVAELRIFLFPGFKAVAVLCAGQDVGIAEIGQLIFLQQHSVFVALLYRFHHDGDRAEGNGVPVIRGRELGAFEAQRNHTLCDHNQRCHDNHTDRAIHQQIRDGKQKNHGADSRVCGMQRRHGQGKGIQSAHKQVACRQYQGRNPRQQLPNAKIEEYVQQQHEAIEPLIDIGKAPGEAGNGKQSGKRNNSEQRIGIQAFAVGLQHIGSERLKLIPFKSRIQQYFL